ncbi:unnamed protein product, partial [Musa acuminata subsp. burmannicoides]
MRREGRQHGMVRSSAILPAESDPRPNNARVPNHVGAPPAAGFFAKAPSRPTNHSKCTARCRRERCKDCHFSPVSKSRDKAKGAHKLRSCDVVLNHRLVLWRVVDGGRLLSSRKISASEIVDHLYASSQHEGDDYDDQNMEEGAGYGHGGPLLEAVDPKEGHSGAKYEETGESSIDSDEDSEIGFHMIGPAPCFAPVNLVAAKLVSACFSLDRPSYADRVFAHVPRPSPFLWNSMIKGYVGLGRHRDALLVYRRMLDCGCCLDSFSFTSALKACSNLLALEEGMALHGHVLKLGLGADIYIATSLMDLYGMCSQALDARKVFDHMPDKDVVAWNVMLSSYARLGMMRLAEQLFEEIPLRNLHGLKPDKVMVVTMLSAIADLGMLDSGKWFHEYVKKNEIAIDAYVGNALVDMYAKCGSIQDARLVFDEIIQKNISCYNSMIFGLAAHGLGEEALEIFTDAERTGIGIDDITMTAVLTACSHSGLVEEGLKYFKTMQNVYGIEPKKEHYGCIVDLLGRAGRFYEAMQIIETTEDDSFILGTLAAACRTHGNLG